MSYCLTYVDAGQHYQLEVDSREQADQLARLLPDGQVVGTALTVEELGPALTAWATVRQALHRIGSEA